MFLILLILQDLDSLETILDAWEKCGAKSITVLHGTAFLKNTEKQALQEDFPLIPAMDDILESDEEPSRTVLCVAQTREIADNLLDETIKITGPLTQTGKGIFLVLPVTSAYGLK